jgi:hypothetical protein
MIKLAIKQIVPVDLTKDIEFLVEYSNEKVKQEYSKVIHVVPGKDISQLLPKELDGLVNLQITAEGNINLNKVMPGIELHLDAYNGVINNCDLQLEALFVSAKTIDLHHNISVMNKISLAASKGLNNYSNLIANKANLTTDGKVVNFNKFVALTNMDIKGKSDFTNKGVWGSRGSLWHDGHSILNSGVFNAKDAKINLSKHSQEERHSLFTNDNLFVINNILKMSANKTTVNTGDFLVLGDATFTLSSLYNKGKMASNGKFYVDTKTHITNKKNGYLFAGDRLKVIFRKKNYGNVFNFGNITADVVAIRACQNFSNDLDGQIICRDFQLPASKLFLNAGKIYGKEKCILNLNNIKGHKATNTSSGQILSNTKVSLVVANDFTNYGYISGHQQVKGFCYGSLFNLEGKINSEAILELKAIFKLVNETEICGKETTITSEYINNKQQGSIIGAESLTVKGEILDNAGKLLSDKQLDLDLETLIKNFKFGIIYSANDLNLHFGIESKNSGVLEGTNSLKINSEQGLFTNSKRGEIHSHHLAANVHGTTNAGLISAKQLTSNSKWLFNRGDITAEQAVIKTQNIFRNLQQGTIQVDSIAQIVSENNFDNMGELLSNDRLSIIGKEVYIYAKSKLSTQHELYLEAVDLFAKGEIQSGGDLLLLIKENFEHEEAKIAANGELALRLKDGQQVKYNINTPGGMQIEFITKEGVLYNNAKLQAGEDLIINEPGYVIVNGQYSADAQILAGNRLAITAKQVENKQGTLSGRDGLITTTEGGFTSHGKLDFTDNLYINAKQEIVLDGQLKLGRVFQAIAEGYVSISDSIEAQDIVIASLLNNVEVHSHKVRVGNGENFAEKLHQTRLHAKNLLKIFAGGNILLEAVGTESGAAGTEIEAIGKILDIPISLVRQSVQHLYGRFSGTIKDTWWDDATSTHKSAQNIVFKSGQETILHAPTLEAQNVDSYSGGDTKWMPIQHGHNVQTNLVEKTRGAFGSKTRFISSNQTTNWTTGTNAKLEDKIHIHSDAGIELHQPNIKAKINELEAADGVKILHGRRYYAFQEIISKKSALWHETSISQGSSETFIAPNIEGEIRIKAKSLEIETIGGKILSFLDQIKEKPDDTTYTQLQEKFEYHFESHGAPGPGLVALVALATAVATQGTASGWAAGVAKSSATMQASLTAGFQGLCAKAAASFTANNFNLGKAVKELASTDTVKELAVQMISAGVMHKVAMRIGSSGGNGATSTKELTKNFTFGQRAALNVSKAVTNAGLSAAIQGQSFDKALSRNLVAAGAATLVDPILKQVDTADSSTGEVDFGKQVLAHMGAGALTSVITNDPNGIAIGAMSGVINAVGARLAESEKAKKDKGKGKDKVEDTGREQDKEPEKTKQAKGKERVTNHGREVEVPAAKIQNKKQQQTKDKYDLAEPKELTVKQQLFLKIKRQLEVQQRIAAENGQGFDLNQAISNTKRILNEASSEELVGIAKRFDLSQQHNDAPKLQTASVGKPIPENTAMPTKELSKSMIGMDLNPNFGEKLLIGSGRAFVKTGQGIKQLGLVAGEKLGFVSNGTTSGYTADINKETALYDSTLVGQSVTAKTGEFITDAAVAVMVPGGSGTSGAKLIASSAGTGAFLGAIHPTEDGSLTSRAQNAAIGAAGGAVGGYVFGKTAQGLKWVWKEGKVQHGLYNFENKVYVTHAFSKTRGGKIKHGHVLDTPQNRRIIVETYADKKNFIGTDKWGKEYFAKLLPDGRESWVRKRGDIYESAGINNIPKFFNPDHTLVHNKLIVKGPKP